MNDAMKLGTPELGTQDLRAQDFGVLSDAETFDGEHLAEAALVLIADGAASLVSDRARAHAESCSSCATAIGEQAIAASEVHVAFAGLGIAERERLLEPRPTEATRAERVLRHVAVVSRDAHEPTKGAQGLVSPKQAEVSDATQALDEPTSDRRRTRGGGWWIAAGLLVAAIASAPSLSGLARGISEVREALLIVVAVSVQAEQALRVASGRLEILRTSASWTAAIAMVGVGLWIARRDPHRGTSRTKHATEATEAHGK